MKEFYIMLAILFIVCTLGLVDIRLKFSDGSKFEYKGLISRIIE